jgi:hypothetical protein
MSSAAETTRATAAAAEGQEVSLLDKIISEGRLARDDEQRALARDLIGEFVAQVMDGTMTISKDTQAMINARIGQLDRLISRQLNEIIHHEEFQKLEASWRGCTTFVHQSETGKDLKIRVMNASKKDLLKDMEKGARVRPERAVQEGLRGGVRHLRRRPVRRAGRRLRVLPQRAGYRAAGEDLQRRGGGACPVHLGGQPESVQLGRLHRDVRARAT